MSPDQATHEYAEAQLVDGYVSGCLYEAPHYQMTFERFFLKQWNRIKPPSPPSKTNQKETKSRNKQKDKSEQEKLDFLNNLNDSLNFSMDASEGELDIEQGIFSFPFGVKGTSDSGIHVSAEKGLWWFRDGFLYLEDHVTFKNESWTINFDYLIINTNDQSGLGKNPRLAIQNPSGVLGLGRGSKLPAILRAKSFFLRPKIKTRLNTPHSKRVLEAEGGQARFGQLSIFRLPKKYTEDLDSPFAGARVGRNSRFGAFIETKFNLYKGTFSLGPASIRSKFLLLENWYEKRGFGHGIDGKYNMNLGDATGSGYINFLGIKDQDRDDKQIEFTDNRRFFAHWIHRGKSKDNWIWNWEFSRESDEEVREEFDRKRFRRGKPYQNRIFLAHQTQTHRASFLLQSRAEEFVQEVDYLPRLQWDWLHKTFDNDLVLNGHLQFANARLNEAEEPHQSAPSIRTNRADFYGQLSYPYELNQYILEPYVIGNASWYSRQREKKSDKNRTQSGVGVVLASRWAKGIYRFLPRIDARRLFTPTARIDDLPQIDSIDDRHAEETIEMNWRHLVRGKIAGDYHDYWDLDIRLTAFPNRHRDNQDETWSWLHKRFNVNPHQNLEFFSTSEYDLKNNKYREFTGGFVINPQSRVDIGTSSSGREIFSGDITAQSQGHHQQPLWSFSMEHRYTESEPSQVTTQIDLLPRDKWRISYAQEWLYTGRPDISLHRLQVNRDLHDWTLSFDWEVDSVDRSQNFEIKLSPHGWGKF